MLYCEFRVSPLCRAEPVWEVDWNDVLGWQTARTNFAVEGGKEPEVNQSHRSLPGALLTSALDEVWRRLIRALLHGRPSHVVSIPLFLFQILFRNGCDSVNFGIITAIIIIFSRKKKKQKPRMSTKPIKFYGEAIKYAALLVLSEQREGCSRVCVRVPTDFENRNVKNKLMTENQNCPTYQISFKGLWRYSESKYVLGK